MRDYQVTPLTKLTTEDIDKLILHSTISGLRRAAAVTPKLIRVEGNQDIPTIYYIKGVKDPNVDDWTQHALVTDVQRYLLRNGVSSDDSEESVDSTDSSDSSDDSSDERDYKRSRLIYDGFTGKGSIWNEPVNQGPFDEELRFAGCNIKYGEIDGEDGFFLGVLIIADREMVSKYPNGIIELPDDSHITVAEAFTEPYEGNIAFHFYPQIFSLDNTGPEFRINIKWDGEFEESFITIVYGEDQDPDHACHLEY